MALRCVENLTIADKVQWIPICRRGALNGFILLYVSFCCIGKITSPRIIAELYKVVGFAFIGFLLVLLIIAHVKFYSQFDWLCEIQLGMELE